MGILPINNDYNCSAVVGYGTGQGYAQKPGRRPLQLDFVFRTAVRIATISSRQAMHAPAPPTRTVASVQGWLDKAVTAGYVPTHYGNGPEEANSPRPACAAVSAQPSVATYHTSGPLLPPRSAA